MATIRKSKIPWTEYAWPVYVGCRNGCTVESCGYNCYAKRNFPRYRDCYPEMNGEFENVSFIQKNFNMSFPKKPSRVFVNPSSDPFWWDKEKTKIILEKISRNKQHTFIMLTKWAEVYSWHNYNDIPNLWTGVTVNTIDDIERYNYTEKYLPKKSMKFFSLEPIREEIPLKLFKPHLLDWIIIGGQSGPGERFYPRIEYIREVMSFCHTKKIPLFVKPNLEVFDKKCRPQRYKLVWPQFRQYPEARK